MGDNNLAGDLTSAIKRIPKASGGRCRCCRAEVDISRKRSADRLVHTVSEDDLRSGRDVPALLCADCATAMTGGGFTTVVDYAFSTRPACPSCSAQRAHSISCGMPSYNWIANIAPWESSGGCVAQSSRWTCGECGHNWR